MTEIRRPVDPTTGGCARRSSAIVCGHVDPIPMTVEHDDPAPPTACWQPVWHTYGPAGSLWCPEHGHMVDVTPAPPLTGVVHLNFGNVRDNGWADIEAIEAGLV